MILLDVEITFEVTEDLIGGGYIAAAIGYRLPPKAIPSMSCAPWSKMPLSAIFLMPKIAPKSFGFTSSVAKFPPYEDSARCQRRPISHSRAESCLPLAKYETRKTK